MKKLFIRTLVTIVSVCSIVQAEEIDLNNFIGHYKSVDAACGKENIDQSFRRQTNDVFILPSEGQTSFRLDDKASTTLLVAMDGLSAVLPTESKSKSENWADDSVGSHSRHTVTNSVSSNKISQTESDYGIGMIIIPIISRHTNSLQIYGDGSATYEKNGKTCRLVREGGQTWVEMAKDIVADKSLDSRFSESLRKALVLTFKKSNIDEEKQAIRDALKILNDADAKKPAPIYVYPGGQG